MTWKLPFTALGYRFPPSFGFVFREKRPSCKHVEDSSKLQQPKKQKRKEKKKKEEENAGPLVSSLLTKRHNPKFLTPSKHEFDTLFFDPIAPLSDYYSSLSPLSTLANSFPQNEEE